MDTMQDSDEDGDGSSPSSPSSSLRVEDFVTPFAPSCPVDAVTASQMLLETAAQLEAADTPYREIGSAQIMSLLEAVEQGGGAEEYRMMHELCLAWVSADNAPCTPLSGVCGSGTSAVKQLTEVDPAPPQQIFFTAPTAWSHCTATYRLQPQTVNSSPLWTSQHKYHIYSTPTGKWRVTDDAKDFASGGGYFLSPVHNGVWPSQVGAVWTAKGKSADDVLATGSLGGAVCFADEDGDEVEVHGVVCGGAEGPAVQYSVNGEPRAPVTQMVFDVAESAVDFPQTGCSLTIPRSSLCSVMTGLKRLAQQCTYLESSLPEDVTKLYLAQWRVMASEGGRPYYYHEATRESVWDLCAHVFRMKRENGW